MKRPKADKQPAPSAPEGRQYTWNIYHIKGTPAALLGHVEAPDEQTAIERAIEEFKISPALQRGFSRNGGHEGTALPAPSST